MTEFKVGRRSFLVAAAAAAPVLLGGAISLDSLKAVGGGTDALVKGLGGSLGVTPDQAAGGAGALLNIAKSSLGSSQFGAVSKFLPGTDGLLGQAAKLAGGKLPTSMAGAADTFKKLGLKPEHVNQFAGYITDYLGKNGGGSAASLLKGVWK
jgi:hypothetical protein